MNLVVISGRGRGAPESGFPHRTGPQAVASGSHGADGPSLSPRAGQEAGSQVPCPSQGHLRAGGQGVRGGEEGLGTLHCLWVVPLCTQYFPNKKYSSLKVKSKCL